MEDVQFDEQQFSQHANMPSPSGKIGAWLVRTGLAKNENQAGIIMISIGLLFILIAFLVVSWTFSTARQSSNDFQGDPNQINIET